MLVHFLGTLLENLTSLDVAAHILSEMHNTCIFDSMHRPELTIVIFIHYKPRIAVASPDSQRMKMTRKWVANEKNTLFFSKQFHENVRSKTPRWGNLIHPEMQNGALMHRESFKG